MVSISYNVSSNVYPLAAEHAVLCLCGVDKRVCALFNVLGRDQRKVNLKGQERYSTQTVTQGSPGLCLIARSLITSDLLVISLYT